MTSTSSRFAGESELAAPVGLAVVIGADLERVHNEIFGSPVRALGRALRILPRPDYSALDQKLQFQHMVFQRILADFDAGVVNWQSADVAITRSCLLAYCSAAQSLRPVVRRMGKLEQIAFSVAAQKQAEYKRALAYIDANRRTIVESWLPCRAQEHLIEVYYLGILDPKQSADTLSVDFNRAAAAKPAVQGMASAVGGSAAPTESPPIATQQTSVPRNGGAKDHASHERESPLDEPGYTERRIKSPSAAFVNGAIELAETEWQEVLRIAAQTPNRLALRALALRAAEAETAAHAQARAAAASFAIDAARARGLGEERSELIADAVRWLTVAYLPSAVAPRSAAALYQPFEAYLPQRRFMSLFL